MAVNRWEIWNAPSGTVDTAQRSQIAVGYPNVFSRSTVGTGVRSTATRSGKKGIRGTQWETCSRCGFIYTVTTVVYQNGILVCTVSCFDNPAKLTTAWRDKQIAEILNQNGVEQEGTDMRFVDQIMANQGGEEW